ncbi:DUF1501 domain-containing protein [Zavarzinia sp.]|uniref:DUF1501 domain-containing protein n=1 Tax=Zavarzinia sp. TaxID=2027920 RepID=UPI003562D746
MPIFVNRRDALTGILAAFAAAGIPRVSLARAATEKRCVFVVLRGGMDGLTALPPIGDPRYAILRGRFAIGADGTAEAALPLDSTFGLHPALSPFQPLWQAGELQAFHAFASPYRGRSHFDAQKVLESGGIAPSDSASGWLNRLAQAMGNAGTSMAVGFSVPLVLSGSARVATWYPGPNLPEAPGLFEKLEILYQNDAALHSALAIAGDTSRLLDDENDGATMQAPAPTGAKTDTLVQAFAGLGALMKEDDGPRLATIDVLGWDTHSNQGAATGRIAGRLAELAAGLIALKAGLGSHWSSTVVLAASEFGRTAQINGTSGTDHGTGSAGFALGGALAGAKVHANWPGLTDNKLLDGRDLAPTGDWRRVFATVAAAHFGIGGDILASKVFPQAGDLRPLDGFIAA